MTNVVVLNVYLFYRRDMGLMIFNNIIKYLFIDCLEYSIFLYE